MERDPRRLIPHRPPALCIDEVLEVSTDRAITSRRVPESATEAGKLWEPWLIEGLAQTAAVLHGQLHGADAEQHEGLLVGVRRFSVHRQPAAGELVHLHVEVIKRIAPLTLIQGRATVDDQLVATGELKFYVEAAP